MIYCDKRQEYVHQDQKCDNCIFYNLKEDSCEYYLWIPGLIQHKDEEIEEIGNA